MLRSSLLCSLLQLPNTFFFLLGPNILLSTLFSNLCYLGFRDRVTHPYKTKCL
jgi:hypothetical protein